MDKRINIYERASQFSLLEKMPEAFMWVSPLSEDLLKKYHLVQKKAKATHRVYKDVLIYRHDYTLSALDRAFIDALKKQIK